MHTRLWRLRRARPLLALYFLGLAACGALPDVQPFVGATGDLRDALVQVGPAVTAEVANLPALESAGEEEPADYVGKITTAWNIRLGAVNAMYEYSESLAAIVGAGNEGAESAEKLGQAFNGLVEKSKVIIPGAEAASQVGNAIALVAKTYVNIRAMSDLEDALGAAQPGINAFTKLLAADLADLDEIVLDAQGAVENQRFFDNNDNYAALEELVDQRTRLQRVYAKAQAENTEHLERMTDNVIAGTGSLTPLPFSKDQLKEMSDAIAEVEKLVKANDSWLLPLEAEEKKEQERVAATRQLIASTQAGVRQWAVAHGNLVAAVQAGRAPDFHTLIKTAVEIEDLVIKFRAQ